MAERPTAAEIRERIRECALHYGGAVPPDAALVWDGYLAALIEWGLLTPEEHGELSELLPNVENNPVMGIFLGYSR